MLKKIALALILIIPMSVAAQTLKFGHIATNEIIPLMPEFTAAQAEMEKLQKTFEDEMKRMEDEFNRKLQELQTANADGSLPANILERRQKELADISEKSQQYQQDFYQQGQQKQAELINPIYQKIDKAIKEVGDAEGFTYIFNTSATNMPYIPYINESQSTDVSAKVKAKLGI